MSHDPNERVGLATIEYGNAFHDQVIPFIVERSLRQARLLIVQQQISDAEVYYMNQSALTLLTTFARLSLAPSRAERSLLIWYGEVTPRLWSGVGEGGGPGGGGYRWR